MKKLIASFFALSLLFSFGFASSQLEDAVSWMHDNGLTKFDNSTDFMADKSLRRDEATKFFGQYATAIQKSTTDETKTECNSFTDLNEGWEDLKGNMQDACKLGLFKGSKGKFMPKGLLTKGQAITVLIRMIDGYKDESQGHFAQKYYEKAQQLELLEGVDISPSNFDANITRGDVAILIYNTFNLPGVKISNKDIQYIESEVARISKEFKADSLERRNYIDRNFYQKEEEIGSKEEKISSSILRKLEEDTEIIYLDRFTCKILDIESMIGGELDSNTQSIGINIDCKNISKTGSKIDFMFAIRDLSSKQISAYVYINNESAKNKSGFKFIDFYGNSNIKSPSIDSSQTIEPGKSTNGRILANIPKDISRIRYMLIDGNSIGGKIVDLKPITLQSKDQQIEAWRNSCYEDIGVTDCFAMEFGIITEGISESMFTILNSQLKEEGRDYYKIQIRDSNIGNQYCQKDNISQTCVWIRNGIVESKTTIYLN